MRDAGYDDVERGERGSSEEHLTMTQFKMQQEQARLESIEDKIDKKKQTLEKYNERIRELAKQGGRHFSRADRRFEE